MHNFRIGVNLEIDLALENTHLFGGKVVIGDNVMMGQHCIIHTRNHRFDRTDIPM